MLRSIGSWAALGLAGTVVGVGLLANVAWGQPEGGQPRPRQPEGRQPGEGREPGRDGPPRATLEGAMRQMNRGYTMVEEAIGDPDMKAETLHGIWFMQRASASAKMAPTHEGWDEERVEEFQRSQIELMRVVLDLELAVLDEDAETRDALFEHLGELRDEGHAAFEVGEDEAEGEEAGGGR